MTTVNTNLDFKDYLHLAIVLTVAVATRIYQLGDASLWLDEVASIRGASLPMSTLWVSAYDPTPPLHYTLIKMLLNFGHSELLLRAPSVVCGVLTIAVTYLSTRIIAGSMAAFSTALLLSLSFYNIEYSQEARAYALVSLCVSVSFYGLTKLCLRWENSCLGFSAWEFFKSGGGLYALGLICALYTHNIAVFYWLGVQFFFLVWWLKPFRFSPLCLAYWFTLNFSLLLLWIPWFLASLEIMGGTSFTWLPHFDPETAFHYWRSVHGMPSKVFGQPYFNLFLLALGLVGLISLRHRYAMAGLFLALLLSSSVLIWAYGFISSPVYMPRTILWGSLFSAMLVGMGVAVFPARLGYFVSLLIFLGGASGVAQYYDENRAENEDWRSAAAFFMEKQRPNDILLFRATYVAPSFLYYIGDHSPDWEIKGWKCAREIQVSGKIRTSGPILVVDWSNSGPEPKTSLPPKAEASLWVVEAHCSTENWAKADALLSPHWRLLKSYDFKGGYLHHLVPSGF